MINTKNAELSRAQAIEILRNKTAYAFEGGGTLGIAHISAIETLQKLGGFQNITHVTGSSIGSIVSTALSAGATIEYMKKKMFEVDFKIFQDNDNNKIKDLYQLVKYCGLNKTANIKEFVGEILEDLTGNADITFAELYKKTNIHLTVTYLSLYYDKTLYADHLTEPDTIVRDAVTKSSTIPFFYEAHWEKIENDDDSKGCSRFRKNMYKCAVDGGTLDNYPIHVLREQGCDPINIIGFKFVSDGELNVYDYSYNNNDEKEARGSPENLFEFAMRMAMIGRTQAMHVYVKKSDWKLTIKTNVGKLTSTDFNMTDDQKTWLYQQGVLGVQNYLEEIIERLENGSTF